MADCMAPTLMWSCTKTTPREKITLLTKIWTYEDGSDRNTPVSESLTLSRRDGNRLFRYSSNALSNATRMEQQSQSLYGRTIKKPNKMVSSRQ